MKINLSDLQKLCERLIAKAIDSGFEEIDIESDNYWVITSSEREDFSVTPIISVGSIVDDMESLGVCADNNFLTTVRTERMVRKIATHLEYRRNSNCTIE